MNREKSKTDRQTEKERKKGPTPAAAAPADTVVSDVGLLQAKRCWLNKLLLLLLLMLPWAPTDPKSWWAPPTCRLRECKFTRRNILSAVSHSYW